MKRLNSYVRLGSADLPAGKQHSKAATVRPPSNAEPLWIGLLAAPAIFVKVGSLRTCCSSGIVWRGNALGGAITVGAGYS